MSGRLLRILALVVALGGAGAAAWILTRNRGTMTREQLAAFLRSRTSDVAQPFALDLAMAAQSTVPRDYFAADAPTDEDRAVQRWALLLAAIGGHESAFGSAPGYFPKLDATGWGDRGNAYGFFQIDKRYHWTFIQSDAAQTVLGQALYAGGILRDNWRSLKNVADYAERERLTAAAYNASLARLRAMIFNGSTVEQADATTTKTADGTPYGLDVVNRISEMES